MKKIYRSFWKIASVFLLLLITVSAYAQKHRVTGTVKDTEGGPFPGVNVVIRGTTIGTSTDGDGNYSIEADNADVLVISFIGYKSQEIQVGNQTSINVVLEEDVSTLSEVVVVGYGEMKRTDLSTAQTTVSSDQISKTINTTVEQAIQGRAAGVFVTQNSGQPGGGMSVVIRGISTLSGSTEPLYVIDGIQMQQNTPLTYGAASSANPLAGINPADIESVEVLQGPMATAVYGSRATNGVVVITTKRGKAGETKVNYSVLYALQTKPKQLPVMDLRQYATMYGDIRTLQGGEIPVEFSNPALLGPGTNWQNALFKDSPLIKHQLSLSGGTEKTTFYLSGEFFDQDGVALGSSYKRYNLQLNVDNQVRKWLKIGANLNFNQTLDQLSSTQENVINNALTIAPNIPVKNPDGTWGGADDSNGNSVQFTPLNPVAIANLIQNDLKRKQFRGGLNADVTLLKGLVFKTNFSGTVGFTRQDVFQPTWRLGNKTNDLATLNVNSGNSTYWLWNQQLQYNIRVAKHDISAMVLHEAQESRWEGLSGGRTGFVSNQIPDLNIGNSQSATAGGGQNEWAMESFLGRLSYNYNEKYFLQAAMRADGSVNFGPSNKWGYFPSASAAWRISQEPFMQNVPAINEFKLRLETGLTGNQGWLSFYGPLTSTSTPWGSGFLLSRYGNDALQWEETLTNNIGFNLAFLENKIQLEGDFYIRETENLLMTAPLPDYLGTAGEGRIEPPPINIGAMKTKGWAFSIKSVNYDKGGLTWESNFNISRFTSEVTKFYSETAFVERRPWYVGDTGSGNNWAQRSTIGNAPWLFQGYVYEGIFQTVDEINASAIPADNNGNRRAVAPNSIWVGDIKFKDLNGDNIIDERDKTNIGNPWPKFTLGFTNSVSYKGFTLDVLLTAVYGNDVFNYLRYSNTNPNNINLGRNMLSETFEYAKLEGDGNAAHVTNPGTGIPRLTGSDVNGNRLRITDQYVEDGSYVRVKNVSLTYNVPTTFLTKQNVVKGLRVTVSAQNIATITNYSGFDPEVGAYIGRDAAPDNISLGLDYGRYPLTPTYAVSVGVDF